MDGLHPPEQKRGGKGPLFSQKGKWTWNQKNCAPDFRESPHYRDLLPKPPLAEVSGLLDALCAGRGEEALSHYTGLFYALSTAGCDGLGNWLWDALRFEDAPYPSALDLAAADETLAAAARRDVETLLSLAELDCGEIIREMEELLPGEYLPVLAGLPRWRSGAPFTLRNAPGQLS
jgi:hypothetical protein